MAIQADLLETSFRTLAAQSEAFTAAFYERLFLLCPDTKPLFANADMTLQSRKLLLALTLVIDHLREPEVITPLLQDLGQRHLSAYRVRPADLAAAGAALLETFAIFLGNQWTSELKEAWASAYTTIVQLMLVKSSPDQQAAVQESPPEQTPRGTGHSA